MRVVHLGRSTCHAISGPLSRHITHKRFLGCSLLPGDHFRVATRSIEDQERHHELEYTQSWTYICPPGVFFFFALVTVPRRSLSLKLSDTGVCEPQIRARLGITAQFCKVVVRRPDHALRTPLQARPVLGERPPCRDRPPPLALDGNTKP